MLTKSIISALIALGFAVTLQAPAATAKTNVDINVGIGIGAGYYGPGYYGPGYGPGFIGGGVFFEDHHVSCGEARRIVKRAGFHNVQSTDCSAPKYHFTGWRNGHEFMIRVNSAGQITRVRQI
jgi:hypothetical protein